MGKPKRTRFSADLGGLCVSALNAAEPSSASFRLGDLEREMSAPIRNDAVETGDETTETR
jgi:hypothetical protein